MYNMLYPPTPWGHQACGIVVWCLPPPVVLPLATSRETPIVTHPPRGKCACHFWSPMSMPNFNRFSDA